MPKGWMHGMQGMMMGGMIDPRSRFFMALANDQRLKILSLLADGEKSSADIASEVELDPSVISRHLMMLRNVGMVAARKEGVSMYFRIADPRILELLDLATAMVRDWFDQHTQFFSKKD